MTFVFICPHKIASSFGYSPALSIVNNFESDRSLILGANLNPK